MTIAPACPVGPPPVQRAKTSSFPPVLVTSRWPEDALAIALAGEKFIERSPIQFNLAGSRCDANPRHADFRRPTPHT
jgi:hypothetical protein